MHIRNSYIVALLGALAGIGAAWTVATAGDLTPPHGDVTPTYKNLNQVEPRVPVNAVTTPGNGDAVFRITQPGSYYLTGNIVGVAGKEGIQIESDNVSLDLSGFVMQGAPGSDNAIRVVSASKGIAVRNGTIRGWGKSGVLGFSACIVEDLVVHANAGDGVDLGARSVVRRVTAFDNQERGIAVDLESQVVDCIAANNTQLGISGGAGIQIINCRADGNGIDGIATAMNAFISGCSATRNGRTGIDAAEESRIERCRADANERFGILVTSRCTVVDNSCSANDLVANIFASGVGNRIESNHVSEGAAGVRVSGENNFIARNTSFGASVNYAVAPNNTLGTILGPGALTTPNSYANFEF